MLATLHDEPPSITGDAAVLDCVLRDSLGETEKALENMHTRWDKLADDER